jgi:pimeloyl-ACP methyl ester carboxylesterase
LRGRIECGNAVGANRSRARVLAQLIGMTLPLSTARGEGVSPASAAASVEATGDGLADGPLRIEPLSPDEKPPTFVLRGGPAGPERLVFLHGMCAHALGYAQAFQFSAARRGKLVAPQGDKACRGPWASWSDDLETLNARIVNAFHRLGQTDPIEDIVIIGYSQGALRAEELARRWPERYTRLVLIASPRVASPRGFERVRSTVMMAGERDRQDLMKQSARALVQAGIPSTFMVIPEATHGAMGPTPEKTMGDVLDWVFAHER